MECERHLLALQRVYKTLFDPGSKLYSRAHATLLAKCARESRTIRHLVTLHRVYMTLLDTISCVGTLGPRGHKLQPRVKTLLHFSTLSANSLGRGQTWAVPRKTVIHTY